MRAERLSELKDAWIKFSLKNVPEAEGGVLNICVEDSGKGFNVTFVNKMSDSNAEYSGRSIHLVKSLFEKVQYNEDGTCVEASYRW